MAGVSLYNVTKIYDSNITAVEDFTLSIADGEFMVIVGPSGCGKTTILRIIAGLEEPTAGDVRIGDAPVNNVAPKDRDVAMVFQNYALYPHMTVRRNMAFALKMRKVPRPQIEDRVRQVAALLDIEDLLERKPAALSGGQRQRVALGRAIVRNPKVFLFDEPLSNVDAAMRLAMRTELKTLRRRLSAASVYVTHDQAEAMTLADRICVLRAGRIQQVAEPMEIYDRPANRFVAGFFGTPPMNFLPGRLRIDGPSPVFLVGAEQIPLSPQWASALADHNNSELVLGIRPEDLSLAPADAAHAGAISASVAAVEPLGSRTDLHLTAAAGHKLTAALEPHARPTPKQTLKILLNTKKAHLFQPTPTAKNLTIKIP
ncbi:MAG: sn-glycerol-3-phosphate ABC transporter ATP-binding protein UgpC [Phycisphaerales bacterium]|nr:MAG: sn-glycerol-3-phosphate ABC transporter ATP-binding protein UgpC [Phycisphaerales bacterium]